MLRHRSWSLNPCTTFHEKEKPPGLPTRWNLPGAEPSTLDRRRGLEGVKQSSENIMDQSFECGCLQGKLGRAGGGQPAGVCIIYLLLLPQPAQVQN